MLPAPAVHPFRLAMAMIAADLQGQADPTGWDHTITPLVPKPARPAASRALRFGHKGLAMELMLDPAVHYELRADRRGEGLRAENVSGEESQSAEIRSNSTHFSTYKM
jgi:hypothetical protein